MLGQPVGSRHPRFRGHRSSPHFRAICVESLEQRLVLSSVPVDSPISPAESAGLQSALDHLADLTGQIDQFRQLGITPIGLDSSVGELLDAQAIVSQHLQDRVANYFAVDASPTTDELLTQLQALPGTYGNVTIALDPIDVSGGLYSSIEEDELRFNLPFRATRNVDLDFDISDDLAANDIALAAPVIMDTDIELNFDLSFGYLRDGDATLDAASFLRLGDYRVSVSGALQGDVPNGSVGLLSVDAQNEMVFLDADVELQLDNPDSDLGGNLTVQELTGFTLDDLATSSATSCVSGAWDLVAAPPLPGLAPVSTPGVAISHIDWFTENEPFGITTSGDFSQFERFTELDSQQLLGSFEDFGAWLTALANDQLAETPVPFLATTSVGESAKLATIWEAEVLDRIRSASQVANFDSVQQLLTNLAPVIDAGGSLYDTSAWELTIPFSFTSSGTSLDDVAFGLVGDFAGLENLTAQGNVAATRDADFQFDWVLDLSARSFDSSTQLSDLNGGIGVLLNVGVTGFADAPASGVIGGDVDFNVVLNGTASIPIHIDQSSTDFNTNVGHLVSDLNIALSSGLTAAGWPAVLVATADDDRLTVKSTSSDIHSLEINNAQELGFAATQSGDRNDLTIAVRSGATFDVALDGAATLGDVVAAIQTASGGTVTATLDVSQRRMVLNDQSVPTGETFAVSAADSSVSPAMLGIAGADDDHDGVINGVPLAVGTAAQRSFLENASITSDITLPSQSISGNAKLGFLEVDVVASDGQANLVVDFLDLATGTPGGRLALNELFFDATDDLSNVVDLSSSASAGVHVVAAAGVFGGQHPPDPTVTLTWSDLKQPQDVSHVDSDMTLLREVQGLSFVDIRSALQKVPTYLDFHQPFADLQPVVPQIVGLADQFSAALETLSDDEASTLQQVAAALHPAFGSVTVTVQDSALRLQLTSSNSSTGSSWLIEDLATWESFDPEPQLAGIPVVRENGAGSLSTTANSSITLDLGIDLTNLDEPFLFDSTTYTVDVSSRHNGSLNFEAQLGAVPFDVVGGSRALDGDGNPASADFATYIGSLNQIGRIPFDQLAANVQEHLTGELSMNLPLREPGSGSTIGNLTLAVTDIGNPAGTVTLGSPDLAAYVDAVDLSQGLPGVVEGMDAFFVGLQSHLRNAVFANPLPLVGEALQDDDALFLDAIETMRSNLGQEFANQGAASPQEVSALTATQVRDAIYDALGPDGQDVLADTQLPMGIVTSDDILVTPSIPTIGSATPQVTYDFELEWSAAGQLNPGCVNAGPLNICFNAGSTIAYSASLDAPVRFVVSDSAGFFFDPAITNQANATFDANMPGSSGTVVINGLANLPINFVDQGTDVSLAAQLNFTTPGPGMLFPPCVATASCVSSNLNADVVLNLDLEAQFGGPGGMFPSVLTDFRGNWVYDEDFAGVIPPTGRFGEVPSLDFQDIRVDLRESFVFLAEQLSNIQRAIEPLRQITSLATDPLPVISTFLGDTSIIDIMTWAGPLDGDWHELFAIIDDLLGLIDPVTSLAASVAPDTHITLGSLGTHDATIPVVDFFDYTSVQNIPFDQLRSYGNQPSILSQLDNATPNGAGRAFYEATQDLGDTGAKLDLLFLTEPALMLRLLTSLDTSHLYSFDLVRMDLPEMRLGIDPFKFLRDPIPLPIPPLVGLWGIQFDVDDAGPADFTIPFLEEDGPSVWGHFDGGFDTHGLEQFAASGIASDIGNGFFLDDHSESGEDLPEIHFDFSVEADVTRLIGGNVFNLIEPPHLAGGVESNIVGNLRDHNEDGKMRLDEMNQHDGLCIFDLEGDTAGYLGVEISVGIPLLFGGELEVSRRFDLVRKSIAGFPPTCESEPLVLAEPDAVDPSLLLLNIGDRAEFRGSNETDGDENFRVRQVAGGGVVVEFTRMTLAMEKVDPQCNEEEQQCEMRVALGPDGLPSYIPGQTYTSPEFTGITSIQVYAGDGFDFITIDEAVTASVEIVGGRQNDLIMTGGGPADVYGSDGDDTIIIRGPAANVFGGIDDDIITGGIGADVIDGGPGHDTIQGGAGNDTIVGFTGNDQLYGNEGDDILHGQWDDDTISGGPGMDTITGGDGTDNISGDEDDDTIDGEGGNDHIFGGQGIDTIHGGPGQDHLEGNEDPDVIYGEGGNDALIGGDDLDILDGGAGDDILHGDLADYSQSLTLDVSFQSDLLFGGPGEDTLIGGFGNDQLAGGSENDWLYGGFSGSGLGLVSDINTIHGNEGDDMLFGDFGADQLFGDDGDDEIYGLAGNDRIYGGDGDDTLAASTGNDFLFGEEGEDSLIGAAGDDFLEPGPGNDSVNGGVGFDLLYNASDTNQTLHESYLLSPFSNTERNDFAEIERIQLVGGAGDNEFTITSAWAGGPVMVDGLGGMDTIKSDADQDHTLTNWTLTRGDAIVIGLTSIENADLEGGTTGNRFRLDGWSGTATIDGGAGNDRIVAQGGGSYTVDDTTFTRPSGSDVTHSSVEQFEITGHSGADVFDATGFSGQVFFYGLHGDDQLTGGGGNDLLDGGTGSDALIGNAGDDHLVGGGGASDTLDGGSGADTIHGSDDGADAIHGGSGPDTIFGHGGNDWISGGPGDDAIDAGPGDDEVAGDHGKDLILGGADHDVLYGQNTVGIGDNTSDDQQVDYLYGDYGTGDDEPDSGRDQLFGAGGNDLLFGEGEDDLLDAGAGASDIIVYGSGESATPGDFVPPAPTPNPPLGPADVTTVAPATLPDLRAGNHRWADLRGSAMGLGLSADRSRSIQPSIAAGPSGTYVAWSDNRNGNYEIYVARHTLAGWEELAGSAHGEGVSGTTGDSHQPSISLDGSGNPVVTWTESTGVFTDVRVATFNPLGGGGAGAWEALGSSLSPGGISNTGSAYAPQIAHSSAGPVVAYLNRVAGIANVYVAQFSGGSWSALGTGATSGDGISNSAVEVPEFALTTNGPRVAVAWTQGVGATSQIYLREHSGGASWNQLSGSASGNGLSDTLGNSTAPSIAYLGNTPHVAWQAEVFDTTEIYAVFHNAGWQPAGTGAASDHGLSQSFGQATSPVLAADGGQLHLLWIDDRVAGWDGNTSVVYAVQWTGLEYVEQLRGDASHYGIHPQYSIPSDLAIAVDNLGNPFVAFEDRAAGSPEIFVRGNTFSIGNVYYVNDASLLDDQYTLGIGNDLFAGDVPAFPKQNVQAVLAAYDLDPGDVILVDDGQYTGSVLMVGDDSGVTIHGAPDSTARFTDAWTVTGADDVVLRRLDLDDGLTIQSSDDVQLLDSLGNGLVGLTVSASDRTTVLRNQLGPAFTGILVEQSDDVVIAHNEVLGSSALNLDGSVGGGISGIDVRHNRFESFFAGTLLDGNVGGTYHQNLNDALTFGINIPATYQGGLLISENQVFGANVGVVYSAGAALIGNTIRDGNTGVVATVNDTINGLGYALGSGRNDIRNNATGVQLTGRMQGQYVGGNDVGVTGSGLLGPDDLDHANLIVANSKGVQDFSGTIQFNRIFENGTGIDSTNDQSIRHNLIYRNLNDGIEISAADNVLVTNNTLYNTQGNNNIHVRLGSSEVESRDNILWSKSGYNIYVDDNSQTGFFSDYNTLHATDDGKLVYWTKDFTDILDWQADVAKFDLHSVGTTVVNPAWSRPRFVNSLLDDYQVHEPWAAWRFSSPTVDAGDPLSDPSPSDTHQNLLVNGGFEGTVTGWATNAGGGVALGDPAPFSGSSYFTPNTVVAGFAEQTIDLVVAGFTPVELDSADLVVTFGGRLRVADETPSDRASVELTFLDSGGSVIGSTIVQAAKNTTDRWELLGDRRHIPQSTRSVRFRYEANDDDGGTVDTYLDHAFVYVHADTVLADQGAFDTPTGPQTFTAQARIALNYPDLYVDWERDAPRVIRWDSLGNDGDSNVRIDLYQDGGHGPTLLTNIATDTADDGEFLWIPFADSGIDYDTHGLRIEVSLLSDPMARDRSSEPFSIPQDGDDFYVNTFDDGTTQPATDYTTAQGNNRNTGKRPDAPKPNPVNVLRVYELSSGDSLLVDPGTYPLIDTISLSGQTDHGLGLDRGFQFLGAVAGQTVLEPAIDGNDAQTLVFMDDADLMTIRHLILREGAHGILATNGSTGLVLEDVSVWQSNQYGLRFDGGSNFTSLTDVDISSADIDGISIVGGTGGDIQNVTISNSGRHGLFANDVGTLNVMTADVWNSADHGIYHDGFGTSGAWTDLTVHDNGTGIRVQGNVAIMDSTVYDNAGTGVIASLLTAPSIANSDIYGNHRGVLLQDGTLEHSRVFDNTTDGVWADQQAVTLVSNTIFSNDYGFRGEAAAVLRNNLFYDHGTNAVRIATPIATGHEIVNNTIYESVADGIRATGGTRNLELRNNIVWTESGYGIYVATDSVTGFQSDYNLLYASASGEVGYWFGPRPSLDDWRFATFGDAHSISDNPLFVDPEGADNVLGGVNGDDDNLHVQSLTGSYRSDSGIFVPDGAQSPAIDRGDGADSFANEPSPDGGKINLGAYGNTAEASLSPSQYVLITRPSAGESLQQDSVFDVLWNSDGFTGDVLIEYSTSGAAGPYQTLAASETNDGMFSWSIDAGTFGVSDQYVLRISSVTQPSVNATSSLFSVTEPISFYYVNDGSTVGDEYAAAVGNDSNSGISAAAPKASIRAILETYDLGPGDVILVDTGTYNLTANIVIAADDAGVTIQGPTGAGHTALVDRSSIIGAAFAFEVTGADGVTLSDLAITGAAEGIRVTNSTNFTLQNSTVYDNDGSGLRIFDAISTGAVVRDNEFYGDATNNSKGQQYGVRSVAPATSVIRNTAYHTGGRQHFGIFLDVDGGGLVVTDNVVLNNHVGIFIESTGFMVSGNVAYENNTGIQLRDMDAVDVGQSFQNLAYHNAAGGILVERFGDHYDNEAHDNGSGIATFEFFGTVRDSSSWRNTTGIYASQGTIHNNRLFGNSTGIALVQAATVTDNVAFSNDVGVFSSATQGTTLLANNLLYDNTTTGVELDGAQSGIGAGPLQLTNNTIVADSSTALRAHSNSEQIQLKNNILSVDGPGSYALDITATSQQAFQSDYNLFQLTNGAELALWVSPIGDLSDWRYLVGFDDHSIEGDPLFVDPAGPDGVIGFRDIAGLLFEGFDNTTLQGPPVVTLVDHVVNFTTNSGYHGLPDNNQSFRWSGEIFLPEPGNYELSIRTIGPQRLFVDNLNTPLIDDFNSPSGVEQTATYVATSAGWVPIIYEAVDDGGTVAGELKWTTPQSGGTQVPVGPALTRHIDAPLLVGLDDDFHVASTTGSYHGGAWIADAISSPAIDKGDPTDSVSEDQPAGLPLGDPLAALDGDRVNLGAFGNTNQASRSLETQLQIVAPNGLEKYIAGQNATLEWSSLGIVGNVQIELSLDNGMSWQTLSASEPNDGSFDWIPPSYTLQGMIRVTDVGDPSVTDTSDVMFTIGDATGIYYVNDAFDVGTDQYTTAAGANTGTGTRPEDPMASLVALLNAYDLEPGDVIRVDSGTYELASTIVIGSADAGITIEGPTGSSVALIDRNNNASGQYGFHIVDAPNVTLRNLSITGASHGIEVTGASTDATLQSLTVFDNNNYGINVNARANGALIDQNNLYGNGDIIGIDQAFNIFVSAADAAITNNQSWHVGNDSFTRGLIVDTTGSVTVSGNTIFGNGGIGVTVAADGQMTVFDNLAYDNDIGFWFRADSAASPGDIHTNEAHDNRIGFETLEYTQFSNSQAHNNGLGVFMNGRLQAMASGLEVFDNSTGVQLKTGTLRDSRVYNNAGRGVTTIIGSFGLTLEGNSIYSNSIGIYSQVAGSSANVFRNNLIYDHTTYGIQLNDATAGGGSNIINNTIYEPAASAIVMENGTAQVDLRNNIVWAGGSGNFAISVAKDSEVNFSSDYNLIWTTDGAEMAQRGQTLSSLLAWQLETGDDVHSLTTDPLFVDPLGNDGVLGAGGASAGLDDNFGLPSSVASYFGGVWTSHGIDSPAIDAGDPVASFSGEGDPLAGLPAGLENQHGGRANLGAFGNTGAAARSVGSSVLQLITSNGGERLRVGRPVSIEWHAYEIGATVDIELVDFNGGPPVVTTLASGTANDGQFDWTPTADSSSARIRITGSPLGGGVDVVGESVSDFTISPAGTSYYVNDGSTTGDQYAGAIGSYDASGTSAADPLPSLQAVLQRHHLLPGDTIFVDTGTYTLIKNMDLDVRHSGITLQGPTNGETALFDRDNTNDAGILLTLDGASDVTISHLAFTGANWAVNAIDADNLVVRDSTAFENRGYGFLVYDTTDSARLIDNEAWGTSGNFLIDQDFNFWLEGSNMWIEGNVSYTVGSPVGTGFDIDADGTLMVLNNESYNNFVGFQVRAESGEIVGNSSHDNTHGFNLDDFSSTDLLQAYDNIASHNTGNGFRIDRNVVLYGNVATTNGTGVFSDETSGSYVGTDAFLGTDVAYENLVFNNGTGIYADGGVVQYNRVFGNTGAGIRLPNWVVDVVGNVVYGNSTGIHMSSLGRGSDIFNNLIYDNANLGLYVSNTGTTGTGIGAAHIAHNTIWHDVGTAVRLLNNGNDLTMRNNLVVVRGGPGLEIDGNTTGMISDHNDVFLATGAATFGQWQGTNAADLAAWQALTGLDANSLSVDPLFNDIDGLDNRLGWDQVSGSEPLTDFGRDDDFQLQGGSPLIDRGLTGLTAIDLFGTLRPGTPDIGAYEFAGSIFDVTPPALVATDPAFIDAAGMTALDISSIELTFSEPLNPIEARNPSSYELREAGINGILGDGDDGFYVVTPAYAVGSTTVALQINDGPIPVGLYQLTIFGDDVHDLSAVALDGDGDAVAGGAYVRSFMIVVPPTGDFDMDGTLDGDDVDLLSSVAAGVGEGNVDPVFDLTGDGLVNVADVHYWIVDLKGTILGDANLDFVTDGQDFVLWNTYKFTEDTRWTHGNFNADLFVDGQDFVLWNTFKFTGAQPLVGTPGDFMGKTASDSDQSDATSNSLSTESDRVSDTTRSANAFTPNASKLAETKSEIALWGRESWMVTNTAAATPFDELAVDDLFAALERRRSESNVAQFS